MRDSWRRDGFLVLPQIRAKLLAAEYYNLRDRQRVALRSYSVRAKRAQFFST